ncbi:IS5 family transposase [Streptomyces hygroscopicus]|uniref:IS5 family transposase n=1 Tax=Streptomyces hygroscopicus TaxID=1912 RepID=UPI003F4CBB40
MLSRGDLTDDEWAVLEPLLPRGNNRCGRWRDHRQVINGIIHRLGTGCQWRQLPARFGPWRTVYTRHMLWSADGTWERLLQHVQAVTDSKGNTDWDINIDSTSIRAHQHSVGAPTTPPACRAPNASKGGTQTSSDEASVGGAQHEALGRSRGGLSTKVHLSADGKCRPLPLLVTPGQRADCTQFEAVMDKIRVPGSNMGRPRKLPDSVSADKAYSNSLIRTYLRRRGILHVIPEKTDTKSARLRRGSHGGRPPGFDPARYKARNTVERAINKIKQYRGVATRYDKRGYIFLGTVTAAVLLIWLRS